MKKKVSMVLSLEQMGIDRQLQVAVHQQASLKVRYFIEYNDTEPNKIVLVRQYVTNAIVRELQ